MTSQFSIITSKNTNMHPSNLSAMSASKVEAVAENVTMKRMLSHMEEERNSTLIINKRLKQELESRPKKKISKNLCFFRHFANFWFSKIVFELTDEVVNLIIVLINLKKDESDNTRIAELVDDF